MKSSSGSDKGPQDSGTDRRWLFTSEHLDDRLAGSAQAKARLEAWQGRFWSHAIRDGMRVPLDGEVAWMLPEGARPYWRGHITTVTYEFSE